MKARQRASEHNGRIKALSIVFCIPYFSVHALGRIFEWVHNRKALSATLKLIKRKQIHGAPGTKIQWAESRRDNAEEKALKVEVVVEFGSSCCLDDSFPMYSGSYSSLACFILPLFLLPWSHLPPTFSILPSWKSQSLYLSSQPQWDQENKLKFYTL